MTTHLGIDFALYRGQEAPDAPHVATAIGVLADEAAKHGWKAARRESKTDKAMLSVDIIRDDEAGEPVDAPSLTDWVLALSPRAA
jgi:hypothetical protein